MENKITLKDIAVDPSNLDDAILIIKVAGMSEKQFLQYIINVATNPDQEEEVIIQAVGLAASMRILTV